MVERQESGKGGAHDFDMADGWCQTHRAFCPMAADRPYGPELEDITDGNGKIWGDWGRI